MTRGTYRRVLAIAFCVLGLAARVSAQAQIAVNGGTGPDPVSVAAGTTISVAVSGGPGNTTDWVALYAVGAADGVFLSWQYLSGTASPPASGLSGATLTFAAPVAVGSYQSGSSRTTDMSGSRPVQRSSSAPRPPNQRQRRRAPNRADARCRILATRGLSGGPSNTTDWVGLYAAGAADPSLPGISISERHDDAAHRRRQRGNPVVHDADLTGRLRVPVLCQQRLRPPGHQLRGHAVAPSSASVTVNGIAPPAPVTAVAGSVATIDVANGPGNPSDWVGLFMEGSPGGSFLEWKYLNGSGGSLPQGFRTRQSSSRSRSRLASTRSGSLRTEDNNGSQRASAITRALRVRGSDFGQRYAAANDGHRLARGIRHCFRDERTRQSDGLGGARGSRR